MSEQGLREIPFNYTSADDETIVRFLFGADLWPTLCLLRGQRVTGRSARLLFRFMGDLFIVLRNAFLFEDLLDSPKRRSRFFAGVRHDLSLVERNREGNDNVAVVVRRCQERLEAFERRLNEEHGRRRRVRAELGAIVGKENILFDPFSIVSHVTDATDWRLHMPVAVATPEQEEDVGPLLKAIGRLGLKAIPRGAGTGLTGGAVPVAPDCVMVNVEKLNRIRGLRSRPAAPGAGECTVLEVEAGTITEEAMAYARRHGFVFATDPTSAWASTIGGNIAENAGGKSAVLWGVAIDNLYAFNIATPGGEIWTVRRLEHPLRKILPGDIVRFETLGPGGVRLKTVVLRDDEIRKAGLWKDITNKALNGLPGLQKEGVDGVIVSAEFILHRPYERKATACLEFFGRDLEEAGKVILDVVEAFPNRGEEALLAMEHFDDQYARAIEYKTKAARGGSPKAVLLIDMVAHDDEQLARGLERLRTILSRYRDSHCFVARDEEEAILFWKDRKRLGAIAKRTNAFKLNEDVVLPLAALAPFARFVDQYNRNEEQHTRDAFVDDCEALIERLESDGQTGPAAQRLAAKGLCRQARGVRQGTGEYPRALAVLVERFRELFQGHTAIMEEIVRRYEHRISRRIVIATHMHAGDGNVHVNIPVFSNDREMMRRAEQAADAVMAKAVELGGVVSGEHGIGVTKIKYLDPERVVALNAHRAEVDPEGIMNPGKLRDPDVQRHIFTPSFNLLELEARILRYGALEKLSSKISACVRCGRCKAHCCVFYPRSGLFYHPRNKNLAIGALIEALLYDAQRGRSTRFETLRHLEQIADHCTICHKCHEPCPVNINTGEVSVLEREILAFHRFKRLPLPTWLTLRYLDTRSAWANKLIRAAVTWGSAAQRVMARSLRPFPRTLARMPAGDLFRRPLAPLPRGTLRDLLPACGPHQALVLRPPENISGTVFYFPGCGSERIFSDVSKAALFILLKAGLRIVLPPPFLCCGFPAKVNAREAAAGRTELRDTIVFSQIRRMFAYLDFDACAVSCGTCQEQLCAFDAGSIFGCGVEDAGLVALDHGLSARSPATHEGAFLYHRPCHDSLKHRGVALLRERMGKEIIEVPRCCSEAGTLALSRPDIAAAMCQAKRDALAEALAGAPAGTTRLLTNCPSCLQGLGRNMDQGFTPVHWTVALAEWSGGAEWPHALLGLIRDPELVTY